MTTSRAQDPPADPPANVPAGVQTHARDEAYPDVRTLAADDAHRRQQRGTLQLLVSRGVFFASAYVVAAILARALGPADYGTYGVIFSQLIWLEMLVHAGVPTATSKLIAGGRHDREEVARAARLLLLGVAGILLATGWLFASGLASLMRIADGEWLYRLALLDLPFAALYVSYEGLLYGRRRFGILAKAQIAYGLFRVAIVFALTAVGLSVDRALMGMVLSSVAVCVLLALWYPPRGIRAARTTMAEVARLAGPMGLCLISGQILVNLDLWALKALWTGAGDVIGEYVGSLNLAKALLVIPTVQAGVLFSSVAWASASGDRRRAVRHIQEATRFALVAAAAAGVILAANGSEVLSVLFSSAYAPGGRFLPLHVLGFALFAVLDVYANALMAVGRQRLVAAVLTGAVPVAWIGNVVLIPWIGPSGAAVSLVLAVSVALIVTGSLARLHFGSLSRGSTVARVLAASVVVWLASEAIHMPGRWVVVKLALLGGLYLLTLLLLKEITVRDLGWGGTER